MSKEDEREGRRTGGERNKSYSDTEWALLLFYKKGGGGNKKVLQNVARFTENKDICSYKTKANLQKTKKNYTLWLQ